MRDFCLIEENALVGGKSLNEGRCFCVKAENKKEAWNIVECQAPRYFKRLFAYTEGIEKKVYLRNVNQRPFDHSTPTVLVLRELK